MSGPVFSVSSYILVLRSIQQLLKPEEQKIFNTFHFEKNTDFKLRSQVHVENSVRDRTKQARGELQSQPSLIKNLKEKKVNEVNAIKN